MKIAAYFQRTYLLFFCGISCGLTVLCNLVELLEKLLYAPHVTLHKIITFVALNTVATWLTIFPITAWLAMVATIYHLSARSEWHVCDVLGIAPLRSITPLIQILSLLVATTFLAKHMALDQIAWHARIYYQKVFSHKKEGAVHHITAATPSLLCSAQTFNQTTHTGTDLTVYHYARNSTLTARDHAETFTLNGATIHAESSKRFNPLTGASTAYQNLTITHEPFALALTAQQPKRSFLHLLVAWWRTPAATPRVYHALATALQEDIRPLTEAFLLALFVLLLFALYRPHFFIILSTYPVLLISTLGLSYLTDSAPLTGTLFFTFCIGVVLLVAKAPNSRILRAI